MRLPCGCCEGAEKLTPMTTANRPGLPALSYRVGTHATFLETMLARLSSGDYPALAGLKTREPSDPSIALLDSWAVAADVLTFYQERIANEGYLRTATERRSILELARLVGYTLRPGVASTVYLAYTLDEDRSVTPPKPTAVTIPAGARAQSVPGPGELPQSFETADDLKARSEWNNLQPRMTRPQKITHTDALNRDILYFDGIATNLKANDRLLLVFGPERLQQVLRRIKEVLPEPEAQRTEVSLQAVPYLVAALVPLLFKFAKALRAFSDDHKLGSSDSGLVALYQNAVELIIENIQLGNSPPLTPEYFTHQRLYSLLRGDQETIDELTAFLPLDHDDLLLRLEGAAAPVSVGLPKTNVTPVIVPLLAGLVGLLKEDRYASALLELLTHLAEQLKPANSQDRLALGKRLLPLETHLKNIKKNDISGWIDNQWNELMTMFNREIGEGAQESIKALITQFVNLLSAPSLRKALNDLFDYLINPVAQGDGKPVKLNKVGQVVKNLKDRLRGITIAEVAPTESPVQTTDLESLIAPLKLPPFQQFANSQHLPRNIAQTFHGGQDAIPQLLVNFVPELRHTLYQAWAKAEVETSEPELQAVYAMRLTVSLFGYNAPRTPIFDPKTGKVTQMQEWTPAPDEGPSVLFLDNEYTGVVADGYVMVQKPKGQMMARQVIAANSINRSEYNLNGKSTLIRLSEPWRLPLRGSEGSTSFALIRASVAYVQSDQLKLAEEPITDDVCKTDSIQMASLIDGLQTGRWLIVSGERTDIPGTSGVNANELVMLAGVEQKFDPTLPGDKTHTFLRLAKPLAYCYKRDTVTIYGNVVKATHGETRNEVLGGGDAAKALQQFTLRQPPLTNVSAANPSGIDSTLKVRINDVLWHETDSLASLLPTDRKFITRTDDDGKTTVIFGNGDYGARLPTGQENVKAVYRNGIGKPGNVKADQITLLATRPLGVKAVTNPLRASGGADKESRDQARGNTPLAVIALDRLVSTQDYADFARMFAGVGKASAARLSDGRRRLVHVTIAGADDIPIEKSSDLYRNLTKALHDFGDPYLPIQVDVRELLALIVSANVRVLPDYLWESVEPKIRAALLDEFGFQRRELGQPVFLSEVVSAIQRVVGVAYVDVDVFNSISEAELSNSQLLSDKLAALAATKPDPYVTVRPAETAALAEGKRHSTAVDGIYPAQLAFLTPDVPDTLILNEVTR